MQVPQRASSKSFKHGFKTYISLIMKKYMDTQDQTFTNQEASVHHTLDNAPPRILQTGSFFSSNKRIGYLRTGQSTLLELQNR